MTVDDYIALVTSQYQGQPNFAGVIRANVSPAVQVQALLASMIGLFDIDTPPVGNQLDIIGQWVGVSRNVEVPITGVYFSWDGTASVGWDFGVWSPSGSPTAVTTLPDDVYLNLIKATIAANHWDGTTNDAYRVWSLFFSSIEILIQDHNDMSYDLIVLGVVDSLTKSLIMSNNLRLRPEGVMIRNYFFSDGPIFGWDLDTALIKGWDSGYWGTEIPGT